MCLASVRRDGAVAGPGRKWARACAKARRRVGIGRGWGGYGGGAHPRAQRSAGRITCRQAGGWDKQSPVEEYQDIQSKESVRSEKEEREKERESRRERERKREGEGQSERLVTKTQTSKQAGRGRGGETERQRHEVREGRDRDRAGDRNRQTERFRNRQTRESGFSEADESPQPLFLTNRFPTPP